MNELEIKIEGTSKIHDIDIPNIYGGFGPKQKSITDKTIAELHNCRPNDIRANVNKHIIQFEENIDYINLKFTTDTVGSKNILKDLGYSDVAIRNAKNIYLLSERGYMKLIKIMDTQLAWDIYKELLDNYFYYRQKEEITFEAEALDRIKNGFNYKEIDCFIEESSGVADFEIDELTDLVPSGKYPKALIRTVLKTNDSDINNILKNKNKKTEQIQGKEKLIEFLNNNDIAFSEAKTKGKILIGNKEYSTSNISFCDDESVIILVLSLQNDKAKEIRKNLLKKQLIAIIPINNISLTEKEKELTEQCEKQNIIIQDLNNKVDILNARIEDLANATNNLEKEKQTAYEAGIEEGKRQAKKEKGKNLFNSIKNTFANGKKWIRNKLGGEKSQAEYNEYLPTDSNRIRPHSNPETKDIGKWKPTEEPIRDKEKKLREEIGKLINQAANTKSKTTEQMWIELHTQTSNRFRNGAHIPKSQNPYKPNAKPSIISSYTLEELEFAVEYLSNIINNAIPIK